MLLRQLCLVCCLRVVYLKRFYLVVAACFPPYLLEPAFSNRWRMIMLLPVEPHHLGAHLWHDTLQHRLASSWLMHVLGMLPCVILMPTSRQGMPGVFNGCELCGAWRAGLSTLELRRAFPDARFTAVDLSPHFLAVARHLQRQREADSGTSEPIRWSFSTGCAYLLHSLVS